MQTRAAILGVIASLLVACGPGARPPRERPAPRPAPATASPAPATGTGNAGTPEALARTGGAEPAAVTPPMCTPSAREPLGDRVTLGVVAGDWLRALEDITRPAPGDGASRWVEVERVAWPGYALVALELPGNAAALVVLARAGEGHCVRAVWGDSFGGLGVTLSISDVARSTNGTVLVALEAVATYNDPAGSTQDPTEHRRVVLAVADARAAVVADTRPSGPFERYQTHHWYFGGPGPAYTRDAEVIATAAQGSMRWRFDEDTWTLVPCAQQGRGMGARHRPC